MSFAQDCKVRIRAYVTEQIRRFLCRNFCSDSRTPNGGRHETERRSSVPSTIAMTLRRAFRPFRPDLDGFLFAQVGAETDGVPLSVISALTRLGLDPWEEAGRLSSLGDREAVEQLARLIAEIPGESRGLSEARGIAIDLILLLPKRSGSPASAPQIQVRPRYWPQPLRLGQRSYFWVACFALVAAALLGAVMHRGLPFGLGVF